jgi:hypothetical protein
MIGSQYPQNVGQQLLQLIECSCGVSCLADAGYQVLAGGEGVGMVRPEDPEPVGE